MNKKLLCGLLLSGALMSFTGCGDSMPSTAVTPPAATSMIKQSLEQYVASGQLDSSIVTVKEQIEELKKSDAAKGEALAKDVAELEATKGAEKIKAKAKEMVGKL